MASNLGIGITIGATLGASVSSAFATLGSKIKNAQSAYGKASKQARTLNTVLKAREARDAAKQAVAQSGGKDARALAEFQRLNREYARARQAALAYGRSVSEWAAQQRRAAAAVEQTHSRLSRLRGLQEERDRRSELRGRMLEAVAPLASVAVPVKMAIDFESSMADVKKVTDFDDAGFNKFSQDILDLSTRLPMAASGLADIAAAAGQSGIVEEELLTFTEDAAKMGVAFDISAAEAGSAMTGFRNNFKLTQDGVRLLGDSMNALANSMDAKAADIVAFANRAGGTAKTFGLTGQEVAALGAAFLDAKVGSEEASTATNAMLARLGNAAKLPKAAQAAFANLGMSGQSMAKAFQKDAQGALLAFMRRVQQAKNPMAELVAIFGQEHAPKIIRLINNMDHYVNALDLTADKEKYAGSMQAEYDVRSKTTANSIQLLKNSFSKLGITIGNVFLPPLNAVLGVISPAISSVADFAKEHEGLTAVVVGGLGGLIGLKAAFLAGSYAMSGARTMLIGFRGNLETARAGVGLFRQGASKVAGALNYSWPSAFGAAQRRAVSLGSRIVGLGRSARSAASRLRQLGPAGIAAGTGSMMAGGLARAGSAGFRMLGAGVRTAGSAFKMAFGPVGLLMMALSYGVDYVMENWDKIGPYFTKLWDWVKSIFNKAMEWISPAIKTIGKAFDKVAAVKNWIFGDDEEGQAEKPEPAKAADAVEKTIGQAVEEREMEAQAKPAGREPKPDFMEMVRQKAAGLSADPELMASSGGVSVDFSVNLTQNGVADQTFAQGVVKALKMKESELQSYFQGMISGIVNQQARLAYE